MPVFQIGGLVKPNPGHWSYEAEDDAEAMGVIIEMRSMMHMRPEARVMWSDVPGHPTWTTLAELSLVE